MAAETHPGLGECVCELLQLRSAIWKFTPADRCLRTDTTGMLLSCALRTVAARLAWRSGCSMKTAIRRFSIWSSTVTLSDVSGPWPPLIASRNEVGVVRSRPVAWATLDGTRTPRPACLRRSRGSRPGDLGTGAWPSQYWSLPRSTERWPDRSTEVGRDAVDPRHVVGEVPTMWIVTCVQAEQITDVEDGALVRLVRAHEITCPSVVAEAVEDDVVGCRQVAPAGVGS